MNDYFFGMFAGVILALGTNSLIRYWERSRNQAKYDEAKKLLDAHGLSSLPYVAAIGTEDEALRLALDRVSLDSRIVLDAHGNVVGRIIPQVVKKTVANVSLRLVVDNTKD